MNKSFNGYLQDYSHYLYSNILITQCQIFLSMNKKRGPKYGPIPRQQYLSLFWKKKHILKNLRSKLLAEYLQTLFNYSFHYSFLSMLQLLKFQVGLSPSEKVYFICFNESPWWKMLFISSHKLFLFSWYLNFCLDFLVM